MTKLELDLRGTRTADDVYNDTALLNDYQTTLTSEEEVVKEGLTEAEKDAYVYPDTVVESSKKVEQFTREDGSVDFTIRYTKTVTTANPETQLEFGKRLVQKEFAVRDSKLAGDAESKRAEIEYNI